MPGFVKVTWLPKSTGIVYRDQPTRIKAREKRVHEYFYGPRNELQPLTFDIKFSDRAVRKSKQKNVKSFLNSAARSLKIFGL